MTQDSKKLAAKDKGGRPVNSKSSDSIAYQEALIKKKFNLPDQHLWALEQSRKCYEYDIEKLRSGQWSPMESKAEKHMRNYIDILKEVASRVVPKYTNIEHIVSGEAAVAITCIVKDYTSKPEDK